eukprot:gb/GFBE01050578.1/.p1 GENE.gb/GFBE01050578.1/~~gb/GFBE01050578.1/.p1  ORF type:complete len:229 (+),score=69.81 gb/GFBE01050578.1/:1-687(+)
MTRSLLSVLAVATVARAQAGKKPLVSTDIVHGTVELFYEAYAGFYDKFVGPHMHHVEKHTDTVFNVVDAALGPEDPITDVCKQVGCKKEEVLTAYETAKDTTVKAKETALARMAQLYEPLNRYTDFVIDSYESAMPKHAGLIPRTPGNLILFVIYISFAVYTLLRVAFYIINCGLSIFCCVCCCGCCRRKKKAEKAAANSKTAKAVQKGKDALASSKAAPAPKKKGGK